MIRKILLILLLVGITACQPIPRIPERIPEQPVGSSVTPPAMKAVPTASPSPTPRLPAPTSTESPTPQAPSAAAVLLSAWMDDSLDPERYDPNAPIIVRFNRAMDPESAATPILTYPWIAGETRWDTSYTSLTYTPATYFEPDRRYQVFVSDRLKSADGLAFESTPAWEINTLPSPHVVSRLPSQTQLSDRRPNIRLKFNRDMDPASLEQALSILPELPFHLTVEGKSATIALGQALTPGVRYEFTLAGDARDALGIPLGDDYRWSYAMPAVIASVTDQPVQRVGERFVIKFNYALAVQDFARVISIDPPLEGVWEMRNAREINLRLTKLLPYSQTYTLRFSSELKDVNGDRVPPPPPVTMETPLPILATVPAAGELLKEEAIRILFAIPVDHESVAAAFHIQPEAIGAIKWRENTLIFEPSAQLERDVTYTVTLDSTARDADGKPFLREPYTWSFWVFLSGQPGASFGEYGPNAQVLDVNGRRAVQFVASQDAESVNFELYRLTLEQFLERYSSGFRGVVGFESSGISLDGAALVKSWTESLLESGGGWQGMAHETIIPDDVEAGLYILNLTIGESIPDQLILVLTRNTLMVKQAEGQLVVWVTDINGEPRPNARISVYARDGQRITQGRADEDGVYRGRVPSDPQPLIVVAEDSQVISGRDIQGTDITVSGLSNEWRTSRSWWWPWWASSPVAQNYVVYSYTDRPIYRPGHIVYFKSLIRQDDDAQISLLPEGTPVQVRIRDARDNIVQTFDLLTNAFGTVSGDFQIGEGVMLGEWNVEVSLDGESHRQIFKVQDYRKPDYKVSVDTDVDHYVLGDPIQVEIDATYFFGQPVKDAKVAVNIYESSDYAFDDWDEDSAYPSWSSWYFGIRIEGNLSTDENGHLSFTISPDQLGIDPDDYYNWSGLSVRPVGLEVTVDDGSRQTVSSFAVLYVFNADENLEVDTGNWLHQAGQSFKVRGLVRTLDEEPVAGRDYQLSVHEYNYYYDESSEPLQMIDLVSDVRGAFVADLLIEQPGYYRLTLESADSRGNPVLYQQWLYIAGAGDQWASERAEGVVLSSERDTYLPGETARLLVESSFDGPALLTFERGTTRRTQPVTLTAPLTLVDVPIQSDDAPNIFITVNAWQAQDTHLTEETDMSMNDARLHTDSIELQVPVQGKHLSVTITPDREVYAPRDPATFIVQVLDEAGLPVAAELSLALVDEAIFSLSEELSGPIHDSFYFARENIVRTYDSLSLERFLWYGGAGGGGGDEAGIANPRSDFPDTAAWFPSLTTDENGQVVVTIDLPDSLTSWRMTARAHTAESQVGEAFINVVTQKPVVVLPLLPQVLTEGDQIDLSAMVHNYTDARLELVVSLEVANTEAGSASPLVLQDEPTKTLQLDPGEVRILGWAAQAVQAGNADVTVSAIPSDHTEVAGLGDAVLLPVAIRPRATLEVSNQIGDFTGQMETTLVIPPGVLDLSTVRIELSRSVAGSLLTGLDYLTGYPYGCVEQTMSRALPNAVVGRAFNQLGEANPTLLADLPPKIKAGLQRLYGYQHSDGGWGWWFDDNTHDYQTAWVVFGLAVTAEAGYEVDPGVIERGANWLVSNLESMDIRTRAYALYSLAYSGHGELEATRALSARVFELDTFSQAALALALHRLGDSRRALDIIDVLAESAIQRDGYVYWPNPYEDGHYYSKTMASTVRSTAMALDAFVLVRPDHPLAGGIVRWLMSQRRQEGWGSTNETSYAILALTDHLLAQEAVTSDTPYQIVLDGEVITSGMLGRGEPVVDLSLPVSDIGPGAPHQLVVSTNEDARLYYMIHSRMLFPYESVEALGGVQVSRLYKVYQDHMTGEQVTSVAAGQLVLVELTFTLPDRIFFLILEDKLPGGLQALNEHLNTTSHEAGLFGEDPYLHWQDYHYNNKEVFADHVSFFITELDAGTYHYSYLARATQTGSFYALPAELYAMYDLSVWGRSSSAFLIVLP